MQNPNFMNGMTQPGSMPANPYLSPMAGPSIQMPHAQGMMPSPGPTPSPFPPSPNMPGPDMQQAGMPQGSAPGPEGQDHEGEGGHKCGRSHADHEHGTPGQMPPPQAGYFNPPLFHEQYQVGPSLLNYGYGFPPFAVPAQQYADPNPAPSTFLGMNFNDSQFWKGALIGAGVVLLLTNESLQKAVLKAGAKMFSAAQQGVEELKEKFEDVQAEIKQKASGK